MLSTIILISNLLRVCNAIPQAATSAAPSPSPSVPTIPWESKVDALCEFLLQQPDPIGNKGFYNGPNFQKSFPDGDCIQVRIYDYDCFHNIPYKMRGIVKWLEVTDMRSKMPLADIDRYRQYSYGYYSDPDDGWGFYDMAWLAFGPCNNRGPQSACGVSWCVNKDGKSFGSVYPPPPIPTGYSPYVDPSNRNNICPWLKPNETTTWRA